MHTDSDTVQAADTDTLRDLFARTLAKAQGLPSKSIFAKAFNPSILPRCATSRFQRLRRTPVHFFPALAHAVARNLRRYQDKDAQEFEAAFNTTFSLGERIKNASPRFKDSNKFVTYRCAGSATSCHQTAAVNFTPSQSLTTFKHEPLRWKLQLENSEVGLTVTQFEAPERRRLLQPNSTMRHW